MTPEESLEQLSGHTDKCGADEGRPAVFAQNFKRLRKAPEGENLLRD
ncbi:MAG: hypothetical protein LBP22_14510 [Deltaproteobacteria bacterium]|nr:hypothetical protein [Deltaproteobacteria bacterium]